MSISSESPSNMDSSSSYFPSGSHSHHHHDAPAESQRVYDIYSWSNISPTTRLVYCQNADATNEAIAQLNSKVLGFDLEWKPNFIKGRPENPVALVQLASADLVLLIHIFHMPSKQTESYILTSPSPFVPSVPGETARPAR